MAAALAFSPAASSSHEWILLSVGGSALLSLGVGLVRRWTAALALSIALLGTEQAIRLKTGSSGVDLWTSLYAAGLLLAAELAWWSIEPRGPAWAEYETTLYRLSAIAGACAGGSALAALVVLAAGTPLRGDVVLRLIAVAAATASVAVIAFIAWSGELPDERLPDTDADRDPRL